MTLLAPRGIITVRELDQVGVPRRTVADRARAGGPWERVLPGVLKLHRGPISDDQLRDAALRYAGPGSMITGLAACVLHGMLRLPEFTTVHMLIPDARKRADHNPVVIERTIRLPVPELVSGFLVAPLVRAVLDAARRCRTLDGVRALLAEAVQRGMVHPDELARELAAGSGRGSALCRLVLQEMNANVHSPAEGWAYRLVQGSGLPPMSWNVRLLDPAGRFLGSPDGWIDDVGLAWEIDSLEYHLSPAAYKTTTARHSTMTAAGITVVHTVPSRLRDDPRGVLDELHGACAAARQRPRPHVTALPRKNE
ncbi:hypothetical protein DFQ14_10795 [Halopolyspora algeriensis]|uniref:Transcriptional regulator, AbiEi antitoxin, Type IV TA system n=1 Tax=Halopolyspora algeriensis TaxID=1500506 RepID=A0A368VT90_9ACTN|nr:hypothetical protein DFQ14_10795 [Halopolyspora algeriensis]TQM56265.1 hypothetical protein FHU43_1059 [Halopolyspora algeriensis]